MIRISGLILGISAAIKCLSSCLEKSPVYKSCEKDKARKLGFWKALFYYYLQLINSFIYFWLRRVFVAVCGLSLVAASGGYPSLRCAGFSLRWRLLLRSTGSRRAGFSSCSTWAQQLWLMGSRAQAQQLWHTGLVAPRHVGSSRIRAQTRVPCIVRQILYHWTTREVPNWYLLKAIAKYFLGSFNPLNRKVEIIQFRDLFIQVFFNFSQQYFIFFIGQKTLYSINI